MNKSILAFIIFAAWALALLVLMEVLRAHVVVNGRAKANEITPDNSVLSPFMQRLARAHANCIEGLPIFGGLLLIAIVSDQQTVTDPLALWLIAARIAQSSVHLVSLSLLAINIRFAFFVVQLLIASYWAYALIMAYVS